VCCLFIQGLNVNVGAALIDLRSSKTPEVIND